MMTLDEFWIVLEDSLNKMQRLSMLTLRHWPESEVVKWRRTPIAKLLAMVVILAMIVL